MTTYPQITKHPRQSESTLSDDAAAVLRANREWYAQFYPSIEGRQVNTSGLAFRDFAPYVAPLADDPCRALDVLNEMVEKGIAQCEFYGPACYGHTTYRFC